MRKVNFIMSPNQREAGTYCFWCGPYRRRCCSLSALLDLGIMPPPHNRRGGATYCFWCWSCRRPHTFLTALYLLNQWVDSDQTCTGALLAGRKEVIRCWWPWPHFQGHNSTLKFSNFDQKSFSAPYLLNQMTDSGLTSHIVTLGWFKDLIWF